MSNSRVISNILIAVVSLSLPRFALAENEGAAIQPTLIGKWQSDREKTMEFNKKYARLEEGQTIALSQIFGNNSLEFTQALCKVHSPALSVKRGDKIIELDEFNETLSYSIIGTTPTEIAILTEDVDNLRALSIWHFEGDYMWTYVGDAPLGVLHVREYFKRVKQNRGQDCFPGPRAPTRR